MNIVGARPNFMKVAPLIREMRRYPDLSPLLVHTGQHYDDKLSRIFFSELGIPEPDINLSAGSGTREEQIKKIQCVFEPLLINELPDLVVVVGDVNSTIACASVARRHGIKVAHVEAGLRSFDFGMPEEHNRRETDQISDFLFVTEQSGLENLKKEKIRGASFLVGNVMIDTLVHNLENALRSSILETLSLAPKSYIAATFHRPSNVDRREDLQRLIDVLTNIAKKAPLVFPIHPRTKRSLQDFCLFEALAKTERLILTEPLGYLDFLKLVSGSLAVVTDSGGIQEETTFLGVPCLTMRENTERPVTISLGTNVLVGAEPARLMDELDKILAGKNKKGEKPPLWDGRAASRIVQIVREQLMDKHGGSSAPS
ncbi:MAG: non-hydrolyzing UDP-N-acetylglucosamine 2-epimerase [Gammaproteobacteria bacterium]